MVVPLQVCARVSPSPSVRGIEWRKAGPGGALYCRRIFAPSRRRSK